EVPELVAIGPNSHRIPDLKQQVMTARSGAEIYPAEIGRGLGAGAMAGGGRFGGEMAMYKFNLWVFPE
ncbi:MAG: hypothetical protein ACRCRW_07665, partial [Aeromonadaceae bacterium]